MTSFEAHALFCVRPDGGHGLLHPDCDEEVGPAFCAALASLSGMLEDAATQADLNEAVRHGISLLSIGTVDQDDLHREVTAVLGEVEAWGQQAEAELN